MTDYRVVFKDRERENDIVRGVSYIDYRAAPFYLLFYGDDGIDLNGYDTAEVEGFRIYRDEED